MSAGKGDSPRNCFTKEFRDNYDSIDWKNTRRNKINKMHGILITTTACWDCDGRGHYVDIELKPNGKCVTCNGKKMIPVEVWKETITQRVKENAERKAKTNECYYCNGSGWKSDDSYSRFECPWCDGSGIRKI